MTEWLADGVRRTKGRRELTWQACALANRDDTTGATSDVSDSGLGFIAVANRLQKRDALEQQR